MIAGIDLDRDPVLEAVFAPLLKNKPLKINVVALAGIPSPYDAWCSLLDGTHTIFVNLSLWDVSRIQSKGRPVILHEITHFLLRQLNRPEPKTPEQQLQDIVFDEGIAHYVGYPGNRLSLGHDRISERQKAEQELSRALRALSTRSKLSQAEKAALLRRANTGPYWEKYGAIAGMFLVSDIYNKDGPDGVRRYIVKGPSR
ncbi:MAG: hypothetical protein A2428_08640 [Bdellovibrionales bacterium RIFOXYC1_FULL_54_43]|nr:MAG: hypothetical protein A2428_08640 [Bdellovibrionales bacterium RIFOXYC1_FULL_54_43]OFZ84283.1 MAG: hypothetical protein A2603_15220 [Bdellovibrionales bacterium RIFOXYD1_FULL_55_31]